MFLHKTAIIRSCVEIQCLAGPREGQYYYLARSAFFQGLRALGRCGTGSHQIIDQQNVSSVYQGGTDDFENVPNRRFTGPSVHGRPVHRRVAAADQAMRVHIETGVFGNYLCQDLSLIEAAFVGTLFGKRDWDHNRRIIYFQPFKRRDKMVADGAGNIFGGFHLEHGGGNSTLV